MSKGSPIVPIRVPSDLLARIDQQIADSNPRRSAEPWTRSAFILSAVAEKLAKMERGRKTQRLVSPRAVDAGDQLALAQADTALPATEADSC